MFKLDNDFVDQRGVGILSNDEVYIDEEYNNILGHPYAPR